MKVGIDFFNLHTDRRNSGTNKERDEDHDRATTPSEKHGAAAADTAANIADVIVAHCFARAADADGKHAGDDDETANNDNHTKYLVTCVRGSNAGFWSAECSHHVAIHPLFARLGIANRASVSARATAT